MIFPALFAIWYAVSLSCLPLLPSGVCRYSLILGSMETMLHGSKEQLLRAEQRAKLMLECSGSSSNINVSRMEVAAIAHDNSSSICDLRGGGNGDAAASASIAAEAADGEADSELPLRVQLTLQSIGEMEYWAEGVDQAHDWGDAGLRSPPSSGPVLPSPGVAAAADLAARRGGASANSSSSGSDLRHSGPTRPREEGGSGIPLSRNLPARFRGLSSEVERQMSSKPPATMSVTKQPAAQLPPPPAPILASSALEMVLQGISRLLPSSTAATASVYADAALLCSLPPPETAIPWLVADDLASQVRYIALQVSAV